MALNLDITHLLAFFLGAVVANPIFGLSNGLKAIVSHVRSLRISPKKGPRPPAQKQPSLRHLKNLQSSSDKHAVEDRGHVLSRYSVSHACTCNKTYLVLRHQVEATYSLETWQRQAYESFVSTLLDKTSVFPCIYATKGYKANEQRFLFLSSDDLSSPANISAIASALLSYLPNSHQLGPNTSLVIICPLNPNPRSVEEYHASYWASCKALRAVDPSPWPQEYPEEIDTDKWCFCFGGIPTFTVVQTPAHVQRHSRYAPSLRLVVQPKWIFDVLFSTPKKRAGALNTVRDLLKGYDDVPLSPDLKDYGAQGSRECEQYFLLDENRTAVCPYKTLVA